MVSGGIEADGVQVTSISVTSGAQGPPLGEDWARRGATLAQCAFRPSLGGKYVWPHRCLPVEEIGSKWSGIVAPLRPVVERFAFLLLS